MTESDVLCDTDCEILVSPIPTPAPKPLHVRVAPARRLVRFFETEKPNSFKILERAKVLLEGRGIEVAPIVIKPDNRYPIDDATMCQLVAEGGLVLSGVAD